MRSVDEVEKERSFLVFVDPDDFLRYVGGGGSHSPDRQEDVVVQEVTG